MTTELSEKRRKRAMIFIFVTVMLDILGIGLIIPVVPSLLEDVGVTDVGDAAFIGSGMYAVYSLALFLFGPMVGNLSDAFGRRPLLLLAIAGLAIDYVFSALAPTVFLLFIGRLIAGICGASYIIANAFIADVTKPEDRAGAFGMIGAALGIGFVLGPGIGGLLGQFGPRVPFWVAAGIAAANFAIGYFVLPETLPKEKRRKFDLKRANPFSALLVFRGYPTVLPMVAVVTLYFFAGAVYPAIWPYWGKARFGWDEGTIGLTLMVFGLIQAIVQGGLSGPVAKRFGETDVALFGLLVATFVALGFGFAGTVFVVILLLVLHGPEGLVHPMLTAAMSKQVPDDAQGELQGGISSLTHLATLFGTLAFAPIFKLYTRPGSDTYAPSSPFFFASALLAVAFVWFLNIERKRRRAMRFTD